MRRCCLVCSGRSIHTKRCYQSAATVHTTPRLFTRRLRYVRLGHHPGTKERKTSKGEPVWGECAQKNTERNRTAWAFDLEALERLLPAESGSCACLLLAGQSSAPYFRTCSKSCHQTLSSGFCTVIPSSDVDLLTEDRGVVWPNWRRISSLRIDSVHSPTSKPCCGSTWSVTACASEYI